ncbi:helix-turn-helix domain-containing protein [Marinisporobacter balticus]|uniref:Helix-turn-helix protein n=1 Tax=Marinisporobacter balticus TaxID=2018667 RepID=A0A4R2KSA5_9FIRM|nr:helix-turn-helix transcriptional regulator [Marinisporobacter balticus]TCO69545.1 helix-turn-helix protein [Marinisporobacter balticus]
MFDKHKFSEMLLKAKGNRTNEDYYQDCGVSRAYISNYINAKRDKAPSAEIIKKLADASHSNITYEDLMIAAGHIEDGISKKERMADNILQKFIDKGFVKENEDLTDEKRKWILDMVDQALEITRLAKKHPKE